MEKETKIVDGKTYYRIGDTWGTVDRSAPNNAQVNQMTTQLQNTGTVSNHYANQFGLSNQAPTHTYYDTPSTTKSPLDYISSGSLSADTGKNSMNAYITSDKRILDTTGWSPQQVHAASLWDTKPDQAMSILSGMGLDRHGNQALPNGIGYSLSGSPYSFTGTSSSPSQGQPMSSSMSVANSPSASVAKTMSAGISGSNNASSPNFVAPNLNHSQLTYFDKHHGGIGKYADIQQERFDDALANKDYELLGKLQEDAKRVGYTLNDSSVQTNALPAPNDYSWISDMVNNELAQQQSAINQELARLQQANELAVNQNNTWLQEQMKELDKNRIQAGAEITNFQNRRGGFYSGGLDYQLGSNNQAFAEAQGAATQEIAARNADIWNRNSLLAQQAAENLSRLQQQAPARIQQLIQEQMERDRQFSLQESGVTGYYQGQPTLALMNTAFNQDMALKEYDLAKANQDWSQAFAQGQFDFNKAQTIWENTFKEKSFVQSMNEAAAARGYQWASLNQREREFIADLAFKEKQLEYEMSKGQGKVDIKAEEEGLVEAIRSGQLSPGQALQRIEQDYQRGYYNITEVNKLKSVLSILAPSVQTSSVDNTQVQDYLTTIPSDAQIEAEARRLGYPVLDYRSYYKDANGKMAGLTFEQWKSLYGPQLR